MKSKEKKEIFLFLHVSIFIFTYTNLEQARFFWSFFSLFGLIPLCSIHFSVRFTVDTKVIFGILFGLSPAVHSHFKTTFSFPWSNFKLMDYKIKSPAWWNLYYFKQKQLYVCFKGRVGDYFGCDSSQTLTPVSLAVEFATCLLPIGRVRYPS